jgi:hypothetical protein
MPLQVTGIMMGVEDLARSKKFYGEGSDCDIDQDHPNLVSFNLGEGSSLLSLYEWEAAAQDAGVSSEGSGFRGVSFYYIAPSSEAVDEVMSQAAAASGGVVKEAVASEMGRVPRVLQRPGRLPLEDRDFALTLAKEPVRERRLVRKTPAAARVSLL